MNIGKKAIFITVLCSFLSGVCMAAISFYSDPVSPELMRLYPVPSDFRNYFFLQSVDDSTSIVVGDFTGRERVIVHILDKNSDNTIDLITEYYPESGKYKTSKKSVSSFVNTDIAQMKKDIIQGVIFKRNYSYKMTSLDTLKRQLKRGLDIFDYEYGHSVKFYDPDRTSTIMGDFFFGKRNKGYDLQFKTNYYKLFRTKIVPPLQYSVYCRNSKDPVVVETVESLIKMLP